MILCASPAKVREILLTAEQLGLMERGEYVFFNVELFARYAHVYISFTAVVHKTTHRTHSWHRPKISPLWNILWCRTREWNFVNK